VKNSIIKFGLIAGTVVVAIPYVAGLITGYGPETYKTAEIIGYTTMILSMLLIFIAVKEYKKKHAGEGLSFFKVFLIGAGISLIAGIMFGIYNLIYVYYIDPDFMAQYYEYSINNIRNSGADAAQIEAQVNQLEQQKEMFMNPLVNFFVMFATVFVIGLIVAVVAGLLQSEKARESKQTS